MKILVSQRAIAAALGRIQSIVDRRSTIPILTHVLISAERELVLTGTDLDIEARVVCAGEIKTKGLITVSAQRLIEAVHTIDPEADIEITSTDTRISVRSSNARFSMPTLPAGDFPVLRDDPLDHSWAIQAGQLHGMLDQVAFAASKDQARMYICGVNFARVNDDLQLAATDTKHIAIQHEAVDGLPAEFNFTIPNEAISALLPWLSDCDPEEVVTIAHGQGRFRLESQTGRLSCKLIDKGFPEYWRAIPADSDHPCVASRKALIATLSRALVAAGDKDRGLRLKLTKDCLSATAREPYSGEEASDEMELSYAGPEVSVSFNGDRLVRSLEQFPGSGVTLSFDPKQPLKITSLDYPNVIMCVSTLVG